MFPILFTHEILLFEFLFENAREMRKRIRQQLYHQTRKSSIHRNFLSVTHNVNDCNWIFQLCLHFMSISRPKPKISIKNCNNCLFVQRTLLCAQINLEIEMKHIIERWKNVYSLASPLHSKSLSREKNIYDNFIMSVCYLFANISFGSVGYSLVHPSSLFSFFFSPTLIFAIHRQNKYRQK